MEIVFNDLAATIADATNITPDMVWEETPRGFRFHASEDVVRLVTCKVSGIDSGRLGTFIGYSNTPLNQLRTLRSQDFKTPRQLLCAVAVQLVLHDLRRAVPKPAVDRSMAAVG